MSRAAVIQHHTFTWAQAHKHDHSSEERCRVPLRGSSLCSAERSQAGVATSLPLGAGVGKRTRPRGQAGGRWGGSPMAPVSVGRRRGSVGWRESERQAKQEQSGADKQPEHGSLQGAAPRHLRHRGPPEGRGEGRSAAARTCDSGAQWRRLRRPQWFLLREEAARLVLLLLGRARAVGTAAPETGPATALRRTRAAEGSGGPSAPAPASAGTWSSVETLRHAQAGTAQALMGGSRRQARR